MVIYQWYGKGYGAMEGVAEYIELAENEESFTEDYATEQEAIEAETCPGFKFARKYDTATTKDLGSLPLGRILALRL